MGGTGGIGPGGTGGALGGVPGGVGGGLGGIGGGPGGGTFIALRTVQDTNQ